VITLQLIRKLFGIYTFQGALRIRYNFQFNNDKTRLWNAVVYWKERKASKTKDLKHIYGVQTSITLEKIKMMTYVLIVML